MPIRPRVRISFVCIVQKMWTHRLHHDGVQLPAKYVPHGVPIACAGRTIRLTPEAEEFATHLAKLARRTPKLLENATFSKNFLRDWKQHGAPDDLNDLSACDFSAISKHLDEIKHANKKKAAAEAKVPTADLDGREVKLKNFKVDAPGIFTGHGINPLNGRIKPRFTAADVTLNMSRDAPLARDARLRRRWKQIVSDPGLEWLARWPNPVIPGAYKYMYVADDTDVAADKDADKFDQARGLCARLDEIRARNARFVTSKDRALAQCAACVLLMDLLLLRVGSKSNKSATGACSIRVRDVDLGASPMIGLSFRAKDQVAFVASARVAPAVHARFAEWSRNKRPGDYVFDAVDSQDVNAYIDARLHGGATAKMIRTCRASESFERRLLELEQDDERCRSTNAPLLAFWLAALETARACNHVASSKPNRPDRVRGMSPKECYPKSRLERVAELRETHAFSTTLKKYVDPRIVMAFCARTRVHPARILPPTVLRAYEWAARTPASYRFCCAAPSKKHKGTR
jgi:DNA topoisomerase I